MEHDALNQHVHGGADIGDAKSVCMKTVRSCDAQAGYELMERARGRQRRARFALQLRAENWYAQVRT